MELPGDRSQKARVKMCHSCRCDGHPKMVCPQNCKVAAAELFGPQGASVVVIEGSLLCTIGSLYSAMSNPWTAINDEDNPHTWCGHQGED